MEEQFLYGDGVWSKEAYSMCTERVGGKWGNSEAYGDCRHMADRYISSETEKPFEVLNERNR
jgi:hypothetical protein